jgi:DNA-binding NarL/FixJ family response regulator
MKSKAPTSTPTLGERLAECLQPKELHEPAADDLRLTHPGTMLGLTPRQGDVLKLIHAGWKDSAIGPELNMSLGTVHAHTHVIFAKLRVQSRVLAALEWERVLTRLHRKGSQGAKTGKGRRL